ncbi:VTT domain-containing protein [Aquabacterium humicola]|uniref:VTT domain-containing protein n=1 Tax=Aquabacterium humicola TaxID=3237377 RepID=UPI00254324DA|nr:VTT domain-containing protein [Rubrivivax pictus]
MDLIDLSHTLQRDVVAVVFVNVLLQQLGLPVPAVPTLLLAGSLAVTPGHAGKIAAAAVLASVVADWVWYHAGRLFGYRVLTGLCKLSINPTSCVSQTESRFVRWGLPSLVVAKFVPGFSTVAPPIAGAMRMNQWGFLLAAGVGGALWAGLAIAAGWVLKDTVRDVIVVLDRHIATALALALAAAGLWLAWKLWRMVWFRKLRAIPQITTADLIAAMQSEHPPLVLDLRGPTMISVTGPIPGTRAVEHEQVREAVADWPKDRPIVTLCACPEDAGAVLVARELLRDGYLSVKPLRGGYEAWVAATR